MELARMLSVLTDPILPVFGIAFLGYVMGRAGVVSQDDARTINRLAVMIFLPVMVFDIASGAPLASFSPSAAAVYFGAEAAIFAAGFLLARHLFGRTRRESILLAFTGIFANNAMYGLPLGVLLYGPEHVLPLTTVVALDAIVTFGLTTLVMQVLALGRAQPLAVAQGILRSPILLGIAAGIAVNLSGLPVPDPVRTFIGFNGSAAAPVALFAMGAAMSGVSFRPDAAVTAFTLIKLAVFPAAVWAGVSAFVPDAPQAGLYVLAAAAPSGAMAVTLALHYDVTTKTILPIIAWTGLLTLFTLAALA